MLMEGERNRGIKSATQKEKEKESMQERGLGIE